MPCSDDDEFESPWPVDSDEGPTHPFGEQFSDEQPNGQREAKQTKRRGVHERFFAVDRRAFHFVCRLGLLSAVSYLVLGCGTGGDQRTTRWSAKAVVKRTGVHWGHANEAIKRLVDSGAIEKSGKIALPHYRLRPAHEIPGCVDYVPPQGPSTEKQERVLALIRSGADRVPGTLPEYGPERERWGTRTPSAVAIQLARRGLVKRTEEGRFVAVPDGVNAAEKPDWVWLPATLVEGAADETPPIERVRRLQSVPTLRLLVDLYHAQNLAAHGGIDWRLIQATFQGKKVGAKGNDNVFEFQSTGSTASWSNVPFVRPFLTGQTAGDKTDGNQRDVGWNVFWGRRRRSSILALRIAAKRSSSDWEVLRIELPCAC